MTQEQSASDEGQIKDLILQFHQAATNADLAFISQSFANEPDALLIGSDLAEVISLATQPSFSSGRTSFKLCLTWDTQVMAGCQRFPRARPSGSAVGVRSPGPGISQRGSFTMAMSPSV